MLNRFVRALLVMIFAPMAVLLIYMIIRSGENGFSQGWAMIVSQVRDFFNRVADSPKAVVSDLQFWQTIATAVVLAIFFKKN